MFFLDKRDDLFKKSDTKSDSQQFEGGDDLEFLP